MATVDPNIYSLQVALQLESVAATESLNQFSQTISNTEENISAAAQNSLNSIVGIIDTINQNVLDAAGNTTQFASAGTDLNNVMSKITDTTQDSLDIQDDIIKGFEKKRDTAEEIQDIEEEVLKILREEGILTKDNLQLWDKIVKTIGTKNKGHMEEGQLIGQEIGQLASMNSTVGSIDDKWGKARDTLGKVADSLKVLWGLIVLIDKETENFTETNYRAYGSQQQIVSSTRQLSMEFGITRKAALETYKALADVKTPRNEIDKLAKTVGMAHRATGVSVQTIADYTRSLRLMGYSAEKTEKQIVFLTEAMRKYGLTTHDVNAVMNISAANALRMGEMFGGGADSIEKMEDARIIMAGFGKTAGFAAEETLEWFNTINREVGALQIFSDYAGVAINNADDFQKAQIKAGIKTAEAFDQMEKALRAGTMTHDEAIVKKEILIELYYANNEAAMRASEALGREAKALKITGNAVGDFAKVMEGMTNIQLKQFEEANNTLTGQLSILYTELSALIGEILQPLADILKEVVKEIIVFVHWIGTWVTWAKKWNEEMEESTGFLAGLWRAVKYVIKALTLVAIGIGIASLATAAFTKVIALFTFKLVSAGGIVRGFSKLIITVAKAFAKAIITILTAIGKGFAAMGKAVMKVIPGLLAISLVILAVGASMYLMAAAAAILADKGWRAIGMMATMGVVLFVLVAAFAGLAVLLGPIEPVLWALAGVILVVGLAVLAAGYGISLMGDSVENLANYGVPAAGALVTLAAAALVLGIAGIASSWGIGLLAIALWAVSGPMKTIGEGFAALSVALKSINVNDIRPAAEALVESSELFATAADNITSASKQFGPASKALVDGINSLALAAEKLKPVAASLAKSGEDLGNLAINVDSLKSMADTMRIAGKNIRIGSEELLSAIVLVHDAATQLDIAATKLNQGAMKFGDAISMLFKAGNALKIVAANLMVGIAGLWFVVLAMIPLGKYLQLAGIIMSIGGAWVHAGAAKVYGASIMLLYSAKYIGDAGIMMSQSGVMLIEGSAVLISATKTLKTASISLYDAGRWLVPASISIYKGMSWMENAITRFVGTIMNIERMGKAMALLALSFGILAAAPVDSLNVAAASALEAIPDINKVANELDKSATIFQKAADKFVKPVEDITIALQKLDEAMSSIGGQGLTVQKDMDKLGATLEKYTQLLEQTAIRIDAAVLGAAIPAMEKAEKAGLAEAVRSETVNTVQVIDKTEGGSGEPDQNTILITKQIALLIEIRDYMKLTQINSDELPDITSALENLPTTSEGGEAGLPTELNQWMR